MAADTPLSNRQWKHSKQKLVVGMDTGSYPTMQSDEPDNRLERWFGFKVI